MDDVVFLSSSYRDLHSLDHFAVECEAAGNRIGTSKSEAMVLSRKPTECLLRGGNEFLPQVMEFKYLGVLFVIKGENGSGGWPDNRGSGGGIAFALSHH